MSNSWHIRNGRIVDPLNKRGEIADLYVENGIITTRPSGGHNLPEINAKGMIITPGFIDIHVHFREPGNNEAETIESGSMSAARGGFTSVAVMPNTQPPTDTPDKIKALLKHNIAKPDVKILPVGCITQNRQGAELADIEGMTKAGAMAFSDDGSTVTNDTLMREAAEIAHRVNRPILDHALDPALALDGVMNKGIASKRLNLPGIPPEAEIRIVQRDIKLAEQTGCTMHIQHVYTRQSAELIRQARKHGLPVSGEATPHHLSFTDEDIKIEDTSFKINPPLGTEDDRMALISAVTDGTIQTLATDHAPHCAQDKAKGFLHAPFGAIGLETAVGTTYTLLVRSKLMSLTDWICRWTTGPSRVLGIPEPSLSAGQPANISIFDLESEWIVNPDEFLSKSRNTPFKKRNLFGQAIYTFNHGKITWKRY